MNTIVVERDTKRFDDYDVETRSFKTVKTVHEQHVIDLDKAIFTCNPRFSVSSIGSSVQGLDAEKLIRGIVVPNARLFTGYRDWIPNAVSENDEILVSGLPYEQRQTIYGMFDEQKLYGIWRYIVLPAERNNGLFGGWCGSDSDWKLRQALTDDYFRADFPLILYSFRPERLRPFIRGDGTVWIRTGSSAEPLIVQSGAFVGISEDCASACSYYYGYMKPKSDRDIGCYGRYNEIVRAKLEMFRTVRAESGETVSRYDV